MQPSVRNSSSMLNPKMRYRTFARRMQPVLRTPMCRTQLATAYLAARQPDARVGIDQGRRQPPTNTTCAASAFYQAHRLPDADRGIGRCLNSGSGKSEGFGSAGSSAAARGPAGGCPGNGAKGVQLSLPQWDEPFYLAGISYYLLRHYAEARQNLARASN